MCESRGFELADGRLHRLPRYIHCARELRDREGVGSFSAGAAFRSSCLAGEQRVALGGDAIGGVQNLCNEFSVGGHTWCRYEYAGDPRAGRETFAGTRAC